MRRAWFVRTRSNSAIAGARSPRSPLKHVEFDVRVTGADRGGLWCTTEVRVQQYTRAVDHFAHERTLPTSDGIVDDFGQFGPC